MGELLKGPKASIPVDLYWEFKPEEKDGELYVEGWASTNDLDLESEIIAATAWLGHEKTLNGMTMLLNHDIDKYPGKVIDVAIDIKKGLYIKGHITSKDEGLREAIRTGTLNKFSVRIKKNAWYESVNELGENIRTITELDPLEISITSLPANRNADILNVIGLGGIKSMSELTDVIRGALKEAVDASIKDITATKDAPEKGEVENKDMPKETEEVKSEDKPKEDETPKVNVDELKNNLMSDVNETISGAIKDASTELAKEFASALKDLDTKYKKTIEELSSDSKKSAEVVAETSKKVDQRLKSIENASGERQSVDNVVSKTKETSRKLSPGEKFFWPMIHHLMNNSFPMGRENPKFITLFETLKDDMPEF